MKEAREKQVQAREEQVRAREEQVPTRVKQVLGGQGCDADGTRLLVCGGSSIFTNQTHPCKLILRFCPSQQLQCSGPSQQVNNHRLSRRTQNVMGQCLANELSFIHGMVELHVTKSRVGPLQGFSNSNQKHTLKGSFACCETFWCNLSL